MSASGTLREQFDASFASPPAPVVIHDDFLAIRAGGCAYVMRLGEISSLHRDRKIVPLIQSAPHRLGIAGIRGALSPVFDLHSLLGHDLASTPRWLVLAAGPLPVAFAFEAFLGHLRVPRVDVSSAHESPARPHVHGTVRRGDTPHLIIHLTSLLESISPKE